MAFRDRITTNCGPRWWPQIGAAAKVGTAIPDTPELRAADEAIVRSESGNGASKACRARARIEQMAIKYRDGQHQLVLASASPAELLAFCVAVEMNAWG